MPTHQNHTQHRRDLATHTNAHAHLSKPKTVADPPILMPMPIHPNHTQHSRDHTDLYQCPSPSPSMQTLIRKTAAAIPGTRRAPAKAHDAAPRGLLNVHACGRGRHARVGRLLVVHKHRVRARGHGVRLDRLSKVKAKEMRGNTRFAMLFAATSLKLTAARPSPARLLCVQKGRKSRLDSVRLCVRGREWVWLKAWSQELR